HLLQERRDVGAVQLVPIGQYDLIAAGHRVTEITVAHHGIEVAEVLLVGHHRFGHHFDGAFNIGEACGRHLGSLRQFASDNSAASVCRSTQSPTDTPAKSARTVVFSPSGSPRLDTTRAAWLKSSSRV